MKNILAALIIVAASAANAVEFRGVDVSDARLVHREASGAALVVSYGECSLGGNVVSDAQAFLFYGLRLVGKGCVVVLPQGNFVVLTGDASDEVVVIPVEAFSFQKMSSI